VTSRLCFNSSRCCSGERRVDSELSGRGGQCERAKRERKKKWRVLRSVNSANLTEGVELLAKSIVLFLKISQVAHDYERTSEGSVAVGCKENVPFWITEKW
jgi:hypothetical protein